MRAPGPRSAASPPHRAAAPFQQRAGPGPARRKAALARAAGPGLWVFAGLAAWGLLVGGRAQIVRLAPATAPVYSALGLGVNLRHMDIDHVVSRLADEDGRQILIVEGDIRNLALRRAPRRACGLPCSMPAAAKSITGTPPRPRRGWPAGETAQFRARLAAPPKDGRDVRVRFAGEAGEFGTGAVSEVEASSVRRGGSAARSRPWRGKSPPQAPQDLIAIPIMTGAFVFAADLLRAMHRAGLAPEVDFLQIASYGAGTKSSGRTELLRDVQARVAGRDALLIDDILESGRTLVLREAMLLSSAARGG